MVTDGKAPRPAEQNSSSPHETGNTGVQRAGEQRKVGNRGYRAGMLSTGLLKSTYVADKYIRRLLRPRIQGPQAAHKLFLDARFRFVMFRALL